MYSRLFFLVLSLILSTQLVAQTDTISYSLGMSIGARLNSQGVSTVDYVSLIKGIQDLMDKKPTMITKSSSDSINYAYFQSQKELMFTEIKQEGSAFLADNGKRPEVTTTESGLQYEVLVSGEGAQPSATSSVTVHYVGKLLNGEMFDSSVDRGEPATFPLNRVIAGWTEGVQLMKTGSKYRFFIPYDLAYGSRGAGAAIPPYSTLIFDVELLSIN